MTWQNRQDHLYKQILICKRGLRLYGALKATRTTMMLTCPSSPRARDWCQPRHVDLTYMNRPISLIQRDYITLIYLIKWGCKREEATRSFVRALEEIFSSYRFDWMAEKNLNVQRKFRATIAIIETNDDCRSLSVCVCVACSQFIGRLNLPFK